MRIVLLGAPGSGKGTQAQRLQAKHGVPQISSGDLLRDAVARGTDLGRQAKAAMDAGQLVSDDVVLGLIRERLGKPDAQAGFILDGFPRNSEQANALNTMLAELRFPLDAVLLLDVGRETLVQRLAGRRICPKCGRVYNISFSAPDTVMRCERCPDHPLLYQRADDKEEVVAKRLEVYEAQTRPLIEHFDKLGLLRVVAGVGTLDEVFERMEKAVGKAVGKEATRKEASGGRAVGRKASGRKASGRKAVGRKASGRKASGRKAVGRKASSRKAVGRKAVGRKAAGRKDAGRKDASKASRKKKTARKQPARKQTKPVRAAASKGAKAQRVKGSGGGRRSIASRKTATKKRAKSARKK